MAIVKFDNVTKTYKTGEHEQKALDNVSIFIYSQCGYQIVKLKHKSHGCRTIIRKFIVGQL